MSRKILIPIYNGTYFANSLKLGKAIKLNSDFDVFFFFGRGYPGVLDHIEQLGDDFKYFLQGKVILDQVRPVAAESISNMKSGKPHFVSLLDLLLRFPFIKICLDFYFAIRDWRRLKKSISFIHLSENVQAYLLPADNRYQFAQIVKLAHSFSAPAILAPHWFAGAKEVEESFSQSTLHRPTRWQIVLLSIIAPSFLRRIKTGDSSFLMIPIPVHDIFLSLILRTVPDKPWVLHSGFSDLILVETESTLKYARSLGFEPFQLQLTGSVILDEIDEVRFHSRRDLRLVVAIAPDMFASRPHIKIPFPNYMEYLVYICKTLKMYGFQDAVLSMHPSDQGDYDELLLSHGFIPSSEPIHYLLARTHFFIATISATIQWADFAGVKTLNYDFYQYQYPDYTEYDSVQTVFNNDQFEQGLQKFQELSDPENMDSLIQANAKRFDSRRCIDQIIEAILLQARRE